MLDDRLDLVLTGHLTRESLDAGLAPLSERLDKVSGPSHVLVVDARRMTGYDAAARARFVEWNSHYKNRLRRVAILTERVAWKLVVSTMALASGQHMKAFTGHAEADAWLRSHH